MDDSAGGHLAVRDKPAIVAWHCDDDGEGTTQFLYQTLKVNAPGSQVAFTAEYDCIEQKALVKIVVPIALKHLPTVKNLHLYIHPEQISKLSITNPSNHKIPKMVKTKLGKDIAHLRLELSRGADLMVPRVKKLEPNSRNTAVLDAAKAASLQKHLDIYLAADAMTQDERELLCNVAIDANVTSNTSKSKLFGMYCGIGAMVWEPMEASLPEYSVAGDAPTDGHEPIISSDDSNAPSSKRRRLNDQAPAKPSICNLDQATLNALDMYLSQQRKELKQELGRVMDKQFNKLATRIATLEKTLETTVDMVENLDAAVDSLSTDLKQDMGDLEDRTIAEEDLEDVKNEVQVFAIDLVTDEVKKLKKHLKGSMTIEFQADSDDE